MCARILVTGSSGFVAGHLIDRLLADGHEVYGVDIKDPEFRSVNHVGWMKKDLRDPGQAMSVFRYYEPEWVFALAADMGGMGFISNNDEQILLNNMRINLNTYMAAKEFKAKKYFFSSSVCVYPEHFQMDDDWVQDMREDFAYPAQPQDAYGWEKLTTEQLLMAANQDYGFPCYIARFHNCYGPYGTWDGGREKAPAALCRKFAVAKHFQSKPYRIEVWGDGKQIRPFVFVTDLVDGILRLTQSKYHDPVNVGPSANSHTSSEHIVSIEHLAALIAEAAGLKGDEWYIDNITGPEGVRYRGASGTLMEALTGWTPTTPLREGISITYEWIEEQVVRKYLNLSDRSYHASR